MNINLMQSVVSSLEAAYSTARVLLEQEENTNKISSVLERIAADVKSDIASKGEQPDAPVSAKAPIAIIMEMLEDSRYALRSEASLAEKAGVEVYEVKDILEHNDVDFVIRTKRGTGETLIGLADRN